MVPGASGILPVSIADKESLFRAYMPFIKNGGIFIPTNKPYNLGDEVFVVLTLMDDPERIPVAGKVVWVTPARAQGGKTPGIGVQFTEQDGGGTRERIENLLAGSLEADRPTHTM